MAGTITNSRTIDRAGGSLYDTTIQHNKAVDDLEKLRAAAGGLVGSATYDPPSMATLTGATTTVTVTGAALGDMVIAVSFSLDLQGISVTAYVSAANTVAVRFFNGTAGTIDLASGTLRVRVSPAATLTGAASDMTAAKIGNESGTAISS